MAGLLREAVVSNIDLFRTILRAMPPEEARHVVITLYKEITDPQVPRGSALLADVLKTARAVYPFELVVSNYMRCNPDQHRKQIYNAFGYLTRKGMIRKVAHGCYIAVDTLSKHL